MSPNDNNNLLTKPFMNKNRTEWDKFSSDLVSVMALKKNKMNTVMTEGKLHSGIWRKELRPSGGVHRKQKHGGCTLQHRRTEHRTGTRTKQLGKECNLQVPCCSCNLPDFLT